MNVRSTVESFVADHGSAIVQEALGYLPRIIALIKAGKARRITTALDAAHAEIDTRETALVEQFKARHPSEGHQ